MAQLLYILGQAGLPDPALFPPTGTEGMTTAVLIQDAVTLSQVPAHKVYALQDDLAERKVSSVFPAISYRDLLRMIFEADRVVAM